MSPPWHMLVPMASNQNHHTTAASSSSAPAIAVLTEGPRHTFQLLLKEVQQHQDLIRQDPRQLARPMRIVVPSANLSRQLQVQLAAGIERSLLGVRVQTLVQFILEVAQRVDPDTAARPAGPLFDLLIRREGLKQAKAWPGLSAFRGGLGALSRSARDVLSAGLDQGKLVGAQAALRNPRIPDIEQVRALALLDCAIGADQRLADLNFARKAQATLLASKLLTPDLSSTLWSQLIILGLSDAPGATCTFLLKLLKLPNTRMLIDAPRIPKAPHLTWGTQQPEDFAARLNLVPRRTEAEPKTGDTTSRVTISEAPDMRSEVAHVAASIQQLLRQGVSPERIAVVARSTDDYGPLVRDEFQHHAVPFSGGHVPKDLLPSQRAHQAWTHFLEQGQDTLLDQWFQMQEHPQADLRLGLRTLGLQTLSDLCNIDLDKCLAGRNGLALPLRHLIAPDQEGTDLEQGDSPDMARGASSRRYLPAQHLTTMRAHARRILEATGKRPADASAEEHARYHEQLLALDGMSTVAATIRDPWSEACERIATSLPPEIQFSSEEFDELAMLVVQSRRRPGWGGEGAGVQLLNALRARGMAFDHVFILGAHADNFPAHHGNDPFLSSRCRRLLREVLPDLAVPETRRRDERWLFAALLASAPEVFLSRPLKSRDGGATNPSPLVSILAGEGVVTPHVQPTDAPPPLKHPRRRSATAASAGDLVSATKWLHHALALSTLTSEKEAGRLATGLHNVTTLMESNLIPGPKRKDDPPLSPWMGLTHQPTTTDKLFVTTLEGIITCPWQSFLTRELKLERQPDPITDMFRGSAITVGKVVHAALEDLLKVPELKNLHELASQEPTPVTRPGPGQVDSAVRKAAVEIGTEDGIHLPGLQEVMAEGAIDLVTKALDWLFAENATQKIYGLEQEGAFKVEMGTEHTVPVAFRVDLVRLREDDRVELLDWKTGSRPKKSSGRVQLQASAYSQAIDIPAHPVGAYAYLKEDKILDPKKDQFLPEDREQVARLQYAARVGIQAREQGLWFPRLRDHSDDVPNACTYCDVRDACHQGDSGMGLRFTRLMQSLLKQPRKTQSATADVLARLYLASDPNPIARDADRGPSEGGDK